MSKQKIKIVICGGGNGAHCLAGIASARPDVEVNVLTVYRDEAERWNRALNETNLVVTIAQKDKSNHELNSRPSLVTDNPEVALKGVDIIFLVVPSYVHQLYFELLLPYIRPNMLIVGLPGHAGFEIQCKYILGEMTRKCTIVGFESLPWACRCVKYGKHVQHLGYKDVLSCSCLKGVDCTLNFQVFETIQHIFGSKPRIRAADNVLAITLMAGSILHPPIMYGQWKLWDGHPLKKEPLFYQGVNEEQVNLASKLSDELVKTAKKIQEICPKLDMSDVKHLFVWFKVHYHDEIADDSSLMTCLKTNIAYDGLVHPMEETTNGFIPDFQFRYTSEDVPFGLVVMKGIAELVSEKTPILDEIINWAQEKLGKEYLINTRLIGKDVLEVRAPQSFGLNTLDGLLNFLSS